VPQIDIHTFCVYKSAVIYNADIVSAAKNYNIPAARRNDLNAADDNPNAILKMEVELRDKNQPAKRRAKNKTKAIDMNVGSGSNFDLPMEKVTG